MIYDRWYARAYASADNYHTRKTPTVALSLTVIEVAKFCVAKNKRDIRFLYFCRTRRFAHIGLRSDMRGKVTNIIRDYLHFPHKKRKGGTHSFSSEEIKPFSPTMLTQNLQFKYFTHWQFLLMIIVGIFRLFDKIVLNFVV